LRLQVATLFLVLAACVPGEQQPEAGTSLPVPPELRRQTDLALRDLATRLGIDPQSIQLHEARRVTWPSGATGCPQPGMSYTQALMPGVLIVLGADGKTFLYHASSDGEPFYCPENRAQRPADAEPAAEKL
jgi:hypothetical protein